MRGRPRYGAPLALGILLSVAAHFAAFQWLDIGEVLPLSSAEEEVRVVELPADPLPEEEPGRAGAPPTVRMPSPTVEISRPALPVPAEVEVSEAPEWTPHDVPPRLVNPEQIRGIIMSRYRARETGSGSLAAEEGVTVLWLYVDAAGQVRKMQLRRSSGSEELDAMARRAARQMRFRPALFKGRTVPVWVAQPIRFAGALEAEVRTANAGG